MSSKICLEKYLSCYFRCCTALMLNKKYSLFPEPILWLCRHCQIQCVGCWDPVMEWWANIVGVAASWLLADTAKAAEIGDRLYMLPEVLASSEDPLPG